MVGEDREIVEGMHYFEDVLSNVELRSGQLEGASWRQRHWSTLLLVHYVRVQLDKYTQYEQCTPLTSHVVVTPLSSAEEMRRQVKFLPDDCQLQT